MYGARVSLFRVGSITWDELVKRSAGPREVASRWYFKRGTGTRWICGFVFGLSRMPLRG
jgi:hypothetical protein